MLIKNLLPTDAVCQYGPRRRGSWYANLLSLQELSIDIRFSDLKTIKMNVGKI